MKFGKYAVIAPVEYTLENESDWTWTFKPPTAKDELQLQSFLTHKRTVTLGGRTETIPATFMEMVFEELALTFGGTSIPSFIEEDGEWVATDKPILKEKATKAEVKKVLGEMPTELVLELWRALGEHVPNWGPTKKDPKD